MGAELTPKEYRTADYFSHIDMGFLNHRLAISALGPLREEFFDRQKVGDDHFTVLSNSHLLVTMLVDLYSGLDAPTLAEALSLGQESHVFMSIERLEPCEEIYDAKRVEHAVHLDFDPGKPVKLAYHTAHLVSDTGKMTLARGYTKGYREAIIGLLHDRGSEFEIEPIVIGAPCLDHPRNPDSSRLAWHSRSYGEILPEDIAEFSGMENIKVSDADEWMSVMAKLPEEHIKRSVGRLLNEPVKSDWGGEDNDHFSANVTVANRRRTAAFLFKGPTKFREMTLAMCGKNADQIYRLVRSGADISVVQHSHLIGSAVRDTLRSFVVAPGNRHRKFCFMDGQATYRLLKAYDLISST